MADKFNMNLSEIDFNIFGIPSFLQKSKNIEDFFKEYNNTHDNKVIINKNVFNEINSSQSILVPNLDNQSQEDNSTSPVVPNIDDSKNKVKETSNSEKRKRKRKNKNDIESNKKVKVIDMHDQILNNAGLHNHKPARGRGREKQLKTMTIEQKDAEIQARLVKNRKAARDCRKRKKEYVCSLEEKIIELQEQNNILLQKLSNF